MLRKSLLVLLGTGCVFSSQAQSVTGDSYICKRGDETRKISVRYSDVASRIPCEVVYDKNGEVKVLWRANFELGYCESKAADFVVKQQKWGYSCEKLDSTQ